MTTNHATNRAKAAFLLAICGIVLAVEGRADGDFDKALKEGTLKQANYSEVADLTFGCGSRGAWIMFQPIFNPLPNDTNLEPK